MGRLELSMLVFSAVFVQAASLLIDFYWFINERHVAITGSCVGNQSLHVLDAYLSPLN